MDWNTKFGIFKIQNVTELLKISLNMNKSIHGGKRLDLKYHKYR